MGNHEKVRNALNAKIMGAFKTLTVDVKETFPRLRYEVPFNGNFIKNYISVEVTDAGYKIILNYTDEVLEEYDTLEEVEYALIGSQGILHGYKNLQYNHIHIVSKEFAKKKIALGTRLKKLRAERQAAKEINATIERVKRPIVTDKEIESAIKAAKEFLKSVGEL